jgi:hypothetical protein
MPSIGRFQGLLQRGKVYKTMGLCEESQADFQQLLSFDPTNKKALEDMVRCELKAVQTLVPLLLA